MHFLFVSDTHAVAYEAGRLGGRPTPSLKNSGQTLFSGQAQLLENSERQKIFQYSEKFQGKFCFSGQAQVVQNSE